MFGDRASVDRNYENGEPIGANLMWDRGVWRTTQTVLHVLEPQDDAADIVYGHDLEPIENTKGDYSEV